MSSSNNLGLPTKDSIYANLPTIEQLLEKNGYGIKFGQSTVYLQAMNDEEEIVEPNMEFVKQFDKFASFNKAAGFIEDWIRTKKHNSTDYTNDFPAVLERGKRLRNILIEMRGGKSLCQLN